MNIYHADVKPSVPPEEELRLLAPQLPRGLKSISTLARVSKILITVNCALLLLFLAACSSGTQADSSGTTIQPTNEAQAIDYLKSRGVEFQWLDENIPKEPGQEAVSKLSLSVTLKGERIRDDDLQYLGLIPNVNSVAIESYAITDKGLEWLKTLKDLNGLAIEIANISDKGFATLSELKLVMLVLSIWQPVSDQAIAKVANITTLERLVLALDAPEITDDALKEFGRLKKLRYLRLLGSSVRSGSLQFLQELENLETLVLQMTPVSRFGPLDRLQKLRKVEISDSPVIDAACAELAKLPALEYLDLTATQVGNEGIRLLSKSKSLQTLWLTRSPVGDDGLAFIPHFENLRNLELVGLRISDRGLKHLAGSRLEGLWLVCAGEEITDTGLGYLKNIKTLRKLRLETYHTRITAAGVQQLSAALPELRLIVNPQK